MKRLLLLFLLLLPCLAGASEPYVHYNATSSVTNYGTVSGTTPATTDMVIGIRGVWGGQRSVTDYLMSKGRITPLNFSWAIDLSAASGARFFVSSTVGATDLTYCQLGPLPTVGQEFSIFAVYDGVADNTSKMNLYLNGVSVASKATATYPIYASDIPITIAASADGDQRLTNLKLYEAFIGRASSDLTAMNSATVALQWHTNRGAVPSAVIAGVSNYQYYGKNGSYGLPSGILAETGVSTGKTPGQFDMKFKGKPTYKKRAGWNPIRWARGLWPGWKTGIIPEVP